MSSITIKPLRDDLSFGARVSGATKETLSDEAVRRELVDLFENRGVIVFENVEPSDETQVAISEVVGPLKEHPQAKAVRDQGTYSKSIPGVVSIKHDPDEHVGIVEVDGKRLTHWVPWHFDHCYNDELNRGAVLRATLVPPDGGMTGFADGIELYNSFSPELRKRIEGRNVLYTVDLSYQNMRFGKPASFREVEVSPRVEEFIEMAKTWPRAIHPAVWTRATGEKVMHVSGWMSFGIEGHEDAEGDALLEAVCQEINAKVRPYFHQWTPNDMVIWDNWRMLHAVSGHDPSYARALQRTTIKGDYGLGYFENKGAVPQAQEVMA